jgi:hypothetical protein
MRTHRVCRWWRVHRIGDVDHVARQVDQVAALTGIIFPLGLLRQLDGAGAICEGTAGVVIDEARHGTSRVYYARCVLFPSRQGRLPRRRITQPFLRFGSSVGGGKPVALDQFEPEIVGRDTAWVQHRVNVLLF